jgi:replicative DNA helicase
LECRRQVNERPAQILEPDHFYEPLHRYLFEVIGARIKLGRTVDPKTVLVFLDRYEDVLEIGAGEYVELLAANAPTTKAIREFALTIRDFSIRRQLQGFTETVSAAVQAVDPAETIEALLDRLEDEFHDLRGNHHAGYALHTWASALQGSLDKAAAAYKSETPVGIPWVLPQLETVVGEPLQAGSLYGLLADSGGGKTSLAVQQMAFAAQQGSPVIMFSFEQTPNQIADQIHAQRLALQSRLFRQGRVSEDDFDRVVEHAQAIRAWPLEIHKVFSVKVKDP